MDSENQNEVEREGEENPQASQQAQPELQKEEQKLSVPKMAMPKFNMPKIEFKTESLQRLSNKLKEYKRVLLITKKPDMEEFKTTVKASALGMTIIGVVGFIIAIIAQLLTT